MNESILPGAEGINRQLADAIPFELTLIERSGRIRWSNAAWQRYTDHHKFSDTSRSFLSNYFDIIYSQIDSRSGQRHFSNIIEFVRLTDKQVSLNYNLRVQDGRWLHVYLEGLLIDGEEFILASHVDISEQKAREDIIRRMADVDGLTSLTNRRGLDAFMRTEFKRAQRIHQPVSLLLIDVDFFKKYNDLKGHLAGDDALRTLAGTLNKFGRRPTDLVARYGGEEFAIVLGNTDLKGALAMARQVQRAIAHLQLPFAHGKDGRVSVSIGVGSAYPRKMSSPDKLILLADGALYSAKEAGRDRIAAAEPPEH